MKIIKPSNRHLTLPSPKRRGDSSSLNPLLAGEGCTEYHRVGEVRTVPEGLKYNSRQLRKEQTAQEAKLWKHLRNRKLDGLKFRRQHPIGSYITDFCCMEKRLIIELDGNHHTEPEQAEYDKERDEALCAQGYTILRLWNNELEKDLDCVLKIISELCHDKS